MLHQSLFMLRIARDIISSSCRLSQQLLLLKRVEEFGCGHQVSSEGSGVRQDSWHLHDGHAVVLRVAVLLVDGPQSCCNSTAQSAPSELVSEVWQVSPTTYNTMHMYAEDPWCNSAM